MKDIMDKTDHAKKVHIIIIKENFHVHIHKNTELDHRKQEPDEKETCYLIKP
jgi:hypothetical protein